MGRGVYLKRPLKASVFSVIAVECTDSTAMDKLSVFCHEGPDITFGECFLDIGPLKKDAESIYLALVKCIQDKDLQVVIL